MLVDLVRIQTPDEVTLDGSFRRPDTDTECSLPIDCLIMHHGVGSNFYKSHFHDPMAERFLERGCAVMRVNNRGHDLAYNHLPQGRLGAAFETIDDCRIDWKCWIDFAEAEGFERIGLWGHSLGAVKTIYYMGTEKDARVGRVIASSPPRFSHSAYLARNDGEIFGKQVDLAQKLADAGERDCPKPYGATTSCAIVRHQQHTSPTRQRGTRRIPRSRVGLVCRMRLSIAIPAPNHSDET